MLETLNTEQISSIINTSLANTLDRETNEIDTAKLVEYGTEITNMKAYGNFLNNMLVAIHDIRFDNKVYQSKTPSLLVKDEEYGQIRQTVRTSIDEAYNNQTFEVVDGGSYDDNVFINTDVEVTISYKNKTYEVRKSIYTTQIKNAFTSYDEMSKFVSMVFNQVKNSLAIQDEVFEKGAYAGAIAETLYRAYNGTTFTGTTTTQAINLLYEYNTEKGTALTTTTCWNTPDFLLYCMERIKETNDDMKEPDNAYQLEKKIPTWTENSRVILNQRFNDMFNFRLRANTYNEELLTFAKNIETINNWGLKGSFALKTTIKATTQDGTSINTPYVLGIAMERNALVKHMHPTEVEINQVKSAQFVNYWYKQLANFSYDGNENFTVFIVA